MKGILSIMFKGSVVKQVFLPALVCLLLILPETCRADIIKMKNGDSFTGTVTNGFFRIKTVYGGIRVASDEIRFLCRKADTPEIFRLETVNHDLFSGELLEDEININLNIGGFLPIAIDRISEISFSRRKPTSPILTTVFFMKNKDRFSGTLLNKTLHIQTNDRVLAFKSSDFIQIEFKDNGRIAHALREDKTFVIGSIMERHLKIEPESVSMIAPCLSRIEKIQFNVEKLVMEKQIPTEAKTYDSDGDGVPDAVDACPDTECMDVGKMGCPSGNEGK